MINGTPFRMSHIKPKGQTNKRQNKTKQQIKELNEQLIQKLQLKGQITLSQMGLTLIILTKYCLDTYVLFHKDIQVFSKNMLESQKIKNTTTVKKGKQRDVGTTTRRVQNQETTKNKNKENVRAQNIVDIQQILEIQLSSSDRNQMSQRKSQKVEGFNEDNFSKSDILSLHSIVPISEDLILQNVENNISKREQNNQIPNEILNITFGYEKTVKKTKKNSHTKNDKKIATHSKKLPYIASEEYNQKISQQKNSQISQLNKNSQLNTQQLGKRKIVHNKKNNLDLEYLTFQQNYGDNLFGSLELTWEFIGDQEITKLKSFCRNTSYMNSYSSSQFSKKSKDFEDQSNNFKISNYSSQSKQKNFKMNVDFSQQNRQLKELKVKLRQNQKEKCLLNFHSFSKNYSKEKKANLFYQILCCADLQLSQKQPELFGIIYIQNEKKII